MQGHKIWMEEHFGIHNNDTVWWFHDRKEADAKLAEMRKMAEVPKPVVWRKRPQRRRQR